MRDGPAPRGARRLARALLALAVAAGCASGGGGGATRVPTPATVDYFVRMPRPGADRYEVSLVADRIQADSLDFTMPTWIPGQYGIGPDRVVVESFSANDGQGNPVPARRLGLASWRLYTRDVRYLALAYHVLPDPSAVPLPFRTQLGLHYGYTPGAGLLGTLRGYEDRAVTVAFDVPRGWKAITALKPSGPNRYAAPSYRSIPGTPVVIGDRVADYKLLLQGKPHQVTVHGAGEGFVPDSLLELVDEAVALGTRFLGPPPYERYVFALHFVSPDESGWGAMGGAHGSTVFLPSLAPARLRAAGVGRLLLHQYLHAWIPGRFGPASLVRPRGFGTPPELDDLWFVEGVAEYYANLLPARYGGDRQTFYDGLGSLLTNWRQLGGGDRIDPAALVRRASATGDEVDRTRMTIGGTLATLLIDLRIREETRGLRGLDQAIDFLQRSTPPDGYEPDVAWPEAAAALGVPATTLAPLTGGGTLSIETGLARGGLRTAVREERHRSLGARLVPGPDGRFVVTGVEPGGTAASAGIREGDVLVAINETPVSPAEVVATTFALGTYVREARVGSAVVLRVERDGIVRDLRGSVRETGVPVVTLGEDPGATPAEVAVRSSLFEPGRAAPGD